MALQIKATDAIIVVDMQNDFLPGGSLAVADADQLVPIINKLSINFDHRVFTRDWHPKNHISFNEQPTFTDGSWPVHCVQGTTGAAFHSDLNIAPTALIISKADQAELEAYSGFQHTTLTTWLQERQIRRVFIVGVATDYCVLHTALDAWQNGFDVWVVKDAIQGVDQPVGQVTQAIEKMESKGIRFISNDQLVRS